MDGKKRYIIGITGHRYLPAERLSSLTAAVGAFYQERIERWDAERITVLSSLSEGADTLCAKLALDAGLCLAVPLPLNVLEYRRDFSESALTEFDCLLSLAEQVFVVQPDEPVPVNPQRGFYYRQAGLYVVKNCDILLAVWDGEERDTPDGAGTWETVKLARKYARPVHRVAIGS